MAEAGSHRFDYCAAEAPFEDGFVFTVERDRAGSAVAVIQTRAPNFVAGTGYEARITIGPDVSIRSIGHTLYENILVLPLPSPPQTFPVLARSRDLAIRLPHETISLRFDGAGPAMADLERCFANAARRRASATESLVAGILDQAESGPIQVSTPAGSTDDGDRNFAWNEGPVGGGARENEIGSGTSFLDLVLTRLDALSARCKGRLAPELDAPVEAGNGVIETGVATCREPAGNRLVALLYLRSGNEFAEFVLEAPAAARAAALASRDRIVKIVRTNVLIR